LEEEMTDASENTQKDLSEILEPERDTADGQLLKLSLFGIPLDQIIEVGVQLQL